MSGKHEPVLRERVFLGGLAVSELGDGMAVLAVPLLVLQLTHSPLAAVLASLPGSVGYLAAGLPAGVLADRVNPWLLLLGTGDVVRIVWSCPRVRGGWHDEVVEKVPQSEGVPAVAAQFGPFGGRVWLNTAHQGPLPRPAVEAAGRAAALKAAPHRISDGDFTGVPERLRGLLAELVGGAPEQVVLGNSTSYGLHLVANGLPWRRRDEVLVLDGDYPATVLPWRRLAGQGVRVRALRPEGGLLSAGELEAVIGPRTRVLAVTWVDSFTGRALDLHALGTVCRRAGVLLVVNASQALGARPIDVAATAVDAVACCGYKWLCGPYATGFAWLHPGMLARLRPQQAYWLAMHAGRGLDQMRDTVIRDDLGARAFDVFCPAAFATALPWIASLELILRAGIHRIAAWDQRLVDRLLAGIDPGHYRLVSPPSGAERSTLVVLARPDGTAAQRHYQLTDAGIDAAYREGNLRLSPHLFNTTAHVDQALDALHAPAGTGHSAIR